MRAQNRLHVTPISPTNFSVFPLQETMQGKLARWLTPHQETRLMSDEAARTGGMFIPYPLLGILLTLVLVLGGGIIGLFSQVNALSTTMLLRDSDYQRQIREEKEQRELIEVKHDNTRERMIRLEESETRRILAEGRRGR